MDVFDLFIVGIYTHFCGMKAKGRKVVPWFQTVIVVSTMMAMCAFLIVRVFIRSRIVKYHILVPFLIVDGVFFFIIKRLFFDNGKHLFLVEKFEKDYVPMKRRIIKVLAVLFCLFIPLLLLFIIWFQATHYDK